MNLKLIKDEVLSKLPGEEIAFGEIMFNNCDCQILSQSAISIDFLINIASENESIEYSLLINGDLDGVFKLFPKVNNKYVKWDRYSYACLMK
jgi:hypothetical protein